MDTECILQSILDIEGGQEYHGIGSNNQEERWRSKYCHTDGIEVCFSLVNGWANCQQKTLFK